MLLWSILSIRSFKLLTPTLKKMGDKIIRILRNNLPKGFTITELVALSDISRSRVRTMLAMLEGAERVSVRKVGMAKVYSLNTENKK